jgi:hypothetical protein
MHSAAWFLARGWWQRLQLLSKSACEWKFFNTTPGTVWALTGPGLKPTPPSSQVMAPNATIKRIDIAILIGENSGDDRVAGDFNTDLLF